jgi:small subunit ribosomal protein S8
MVNDHLSDFVTRIRNGYRAGLAQIMVPQTNIVLRVGETLVQSGYLESVEKGNAKTTVKKGPVMAIVKLKYNKKKPAIMGINRVSKPGVRVYTGAKEIPSVRGRLGINILTTHKGIMGSREAKKLNVGGEIICQVW